VSTTSSLQSEHPEHSNPPVVALLSSLQRGDKHRWEPPTNGRNTTHCVISADSREDEVYSKSGNSNFRGATIPRCIRTHTQSFDSAFTKKNTASSLLPVSEHSHQVLKDTMDIYKLEKTITLNKLKPNESRLWVVQTEATFDVHKCRPDRLNRR
jgi:hypothetical protein